jgi:hypothetical protein
MCGELDNRGYSAEAQEFRVAIAEISALRAAQAGAGDRAEIERLREALRIIVYDLHMGSPAGRIRALDYARAALAVGADVRAGADIPAPAA